MLLFCVVKVTQTLAEQWRHLSAAERVPFEEMTAAEQLELDTEFMVAKATEESKASKKTVKKVVQPEESDEENVDDDDMETDEPKVRITTAHFD